jgi:DNA replication initiation complex subunit (GINS family)
LISPQLTPVEQAAYQRRTNEAITTAESNLHQAGGRQLTAAQRDLIEKINGFLKQAHDAIQDSDWGRAQNLAQKAQFLSVDLVNSF